MLVILTRIRSAVEAWSQSAPGVAKWTKITVAQHITVGGLGATVVGTAAHVADELQRWVRDSDIDGFKIVSSIVRPVKELGASSRKRKELLTRSYRHMPSTQDHLMM